MKTINKFLLSMLVLGSFGIPTTVFAEDEDDDDYHEPTQEEICAKDNRGFLVPNEGSPVCLIKQEFNEEYQELKKSYAPFLGRNKMMYIYYSQAGNIASPYALLPEPSQLDKRGLLNVPYYELSGDYGFSIDFSHYIKTEDVGKKMKITLYSKHMKIPESLMNQGGLFFGIAPVDRYASYYPADEWNENREESDAATNSVSKEITLPSDVVKLSIHDLVSYVPAEDFKKKPSENIFDESNPTLSMKIEIDNEVRFDGVIQAYAYSPYEENDEIFKKYPLVRESGGTIVVAPEDLAQYNKAFAAFNDFYYPLPETKDNQGVNANVLNGGITGGIVSTEVGKDLSIEDVDFGKLSIGQTIESVKKDSMVSVRDWTGGNGWKLTAKHKEADRNNSLQLGVQVDKSTEVALSDEAQAVTKGESQLDVTTQGGEYSAKWGTHPTVGEFNNVIEWNLTANITE